MGVDQGRYSIWRHGATHSFVDLGTTSAVALPANPNRVYLLLINDSDVVIYVNVSGGTAAVSTGIRLNASGGSYEMGEHFGNLTTDAITAIAASGASKRLLMTESTG